MKIKRVLTIAAVFVALAVLTAFGIFSVVPRTQAQDQQPPPVPERISFGMVRARQRRQHDYAER
jgi:hypothetical protein